MTSATRQPSTVYPAVATSSTFRHPKHRPGDVKNQREIVLTGEAQAKDVAIKELRAFEVGTRDEADELTVHHCPPSCRSSLRVAASGGIGPPGDLAIGDLRARVHTEVA